VGIIAAVIAISLIFASRSKESLDFAILAPCVAGITLIVGRKTRVSPAVALLAIVRLYQVLSRMSGVNLVERMSWYLYGNYNLSGRTIIWDFVGQRHELMPLLGWGFGSFWQVGSDGPGMPRAIPDSLYLTGKLAFFWSNPWPWVNPSNGAVSILPAKACLEQGKMPTCLQGGPGDSTAPSVVNKSRLP
jgi:O-antigen ligase